MRKLVLVLLLVGVLGSESANVPEALTAVFDEDRRCEVATPCEVAEAVGGAAYGARAVEARPKDGTLLCSYTSGSAIRP